ncbi:hypothetical protein SAMN05216482_8924 [Streptomyces sp. PAN_FS17]|nr:hypothetical protein SAMN05216482_8924 [Streptomyces sp. PAN_FS17]
MPGSSPVRTARTMASMRGACGSGNGVAVGQRGRRLSVHASHARSDYGQGRPFGYYRSSFGRGACAFTSGGTGCGRVMAQRMVRVSAWPVGVRRCPRRGGPGAARANAARPGREQSYGVRGQCAVERPYRQRQGRLEQQEASAARASEVARSSGRYAFSASVSSRRSPGGVDHPQRYGDACGVGDVRVVAGGIQGVSSVAFVGAQETVGLGGVDPGEQMRIGRVIGGAVGGCPRMRSWMALTWSTACWASSAVPNVVTARKVLVRCRRPQGSPR